MEAENIYKRFEEDIEALVKICHCPAFIMALIGNTCVSIKKFSKRSHKTPKKAELYYKGVFIRFKK